MKGEEETQPRLLGSTPIPPGKPLLLEKSQSPVQVPSITPVQAAAPLHSKPSHGTSGTPPTQSTPQPLPAGKGHMGLGQAAGIQTEQPQCRGAPMLPHDPL